MRIGGARLRRRKVGGTRGVSDEVIGDSTGGARGRPEASRMSKTREAASVARWRHRRIQGRAFLRQAPSLGSKGVKAAVLRWCLRKAEELGTTAWRMLGKAILLTTTGAALTVSVGADVDIAAAALVADWLRWHRRRRQFGEPDLQVSKKESVVRALWNTVRRGSGIGREEKGGRPRATDALSPKATVQLCALRLDGAIRCGVGRTPLHLRGTLPPAARGSGAIPTHEWVARQQVVLTEKELGEALFAQALAPYSRREFQMAPSRQKLAKELKLCGGIKVLVAAKLMARLTGSSGQGRGGTSLSDVTANTLVASRLMTWLVVRLGAREQVAAEVLNAQDWATMMGVPMRQQHPVRVGLRAVSESAAKGIVGQAVHVDVARCLLCAACAHMEWRHSNSMVSYASLMSGLDFMAAAMDQVFGARFRFELAAESNATVVRALQAAWGSRLLRLTHNAVGVETERALAALANRLDVLMVSFRCAPWSTANTLPILGDRRLNQLERALEEDQELLRLVTVARPKLVLIECVAGVEQRQLRAHWNRLQGMIMALSEWSWTRQVICPREALGGYIPRRRMWIVGQLRL